MTTIIAAVAVLVAAVLLVGALVAVAVLARELHRSERRVVQQREALHKLAVQVVRRDLDLDDIERWEAEW